MNKLKLLWALTAVLFTDPAIFAVNDQFMVDNVYYKIVSDKNVEVTWSGFTIPDVDTPANYIDDGQSYHIEDSGHNIGDYKGDVIIPQFVINPANNTKYKVIGIGKDAFANCVFLNSVTLPESIEYLAQNAFCDARLIKEIYLPDNVQNIGKGCFDRCLNLRKINIPGGVTEIPDWAFNAAGSHHSIEYLDIEGMENVEYFGDYAFNNSGIALLPKLKAIKYIGKNAFYGCRLTELDFSNLSDDDFNNIADNAFNYNEDLKMVILPNTSKKFLNRMFYQCYNITSVKIGSPEPPYIFSAWNCSYNDDCVLHVPQNCAEKYKADFKWANFKNILEDPDDSNSVEIIQSDISAVDCGIYDLTGLKIASDINAAEEIPAGTYIIKSPQSIRKVIITR